MQYDRVAIAQVGPHLATCSEPKRMQVLCRKFACAFKGLAWGQQSPAPRPLGLTYVCIPRANSTLYATPVPLQLLQQLCQYPGILLA
jgi:hypothetical protein